MEHKKFNGYGRDDWAIGDIVFVNYADCECQTWYYGRIVREVQTKEGTLIPVVVDLDGNEEEITTTIYYGLTYVPKQEMYERFAKMMGE